MPPSRMLHRARVALFATAALTLTGLPLLATPAGANPSGTGLVISEAYGGGGNAGATLKNDFVELYNPTSAAISVGGMSIQYRSSGGSGAPISSGITPLSGSVPARGYFLIAEAAGTGGTTNLPTPDVTGTVAMSGTAFSVWLATTSTGLNLPAGSVVNNAQVVDLVGVNANTFEGAAASGVSNTTSSSRNAAGLDRDTNSSDLSSGTPTPQNSTVGTFPLTATSPGTKTFPVDDPIAPFTLAATGGTTPYSWTATGLPNGLSISAGGTVSGTPTATGASTVTATVTDSASPAATSSTTFTINVNNGITPIADIQGTGASTPLAGQSVTTRGVVTAAYPTGGLNGFFIQTPGTDTTPDASDGIFVYGGSAGFTSYPSVGDSVRVAGTAAEFSGATQLTASDAGVTVLGTSLGSIAYQTTIPGTDCALPGDTCLTGAALDAARETVEGEAFAPTGAFTATDVYDGRPAYNDGTNGSSNFGEIALAANSGRPLVAPTELFEAQTSQVTNRTAYNQAHRIVLDDGSSTSYAAATGSPLPWLTASYTTRVGASVTFPAPVVLSYGFGTWRLEPTSQVLGAPSSTQPQFAQTRAANTAPAPVGGDLELATFNVLNFFPTTGEEYVSSGLGNCSYYSDRQGNRITTNSCGSPSTSSGNGPRGAANDANLTRQRAKIVAAINGSGADIVSLEELENSVKFGKGRDFAISALVDALNSDAGAGTWDYVPSPPASELPALADQDVIRTGFIFKPARIVTIGASRVLADQSSGSGAFANAREPLAQAFKKKGTPNSGAFAVIVNHFKSKGSGSDDGTGQGNANPDRVAQAQSLVTFASQFQSDRGLTRTFLVGDFNAYSSEDPIQVLEGAGYTSLDSSSDPAEETYNFDGQVGSLDHVLANAAAATAVTGADVWEINANEPVYYEYSRFNYNVTDLYVGGPFRSSDHNPEIVGISTTAKTASTTTAADATVVEGRDARVSVTVAAATGGATPTGTVTVTRGGTVLGTGTLAADGTVTLTVDSSALAPGSYTLTAAYGGDDDVDASSDDLTLTVTSAVKPIQILATNDFHGRIANDPTSAAAGAGVMAGAVKQLRAQNPDTVFAAAGDLIGASTFESFIQKDKPTIDALNSAGLEVSAVGNHEFDQGYDDLVNRVMAPYDASTNPYGGAQWTYLGANVTFRSSGDPALDGTWMKTMDGVQVGFIGAVTEHLPELVSPAGISQIDVTDIVTATNAAADDLKAEGADVVVLLVHEGAPTTDCPTIGALGPDTDFGSIVQGVDDDVDAIISGHTHLAYSCSFPVPGWSGRAVTERPVVSAGQYGANLNKLVFNVDSRTGVVTGKSQAILALKSGQTANYPVDQPTQNIVNAAVTRADVLGAQQLGRIAAPFKRGYLANGTTENRGAESTLGNLVAEVQRWATSTPVAGSAQIAFMNPGGLRADLLGNPGPGSARTVTFKQAANVQPFANTLVNMTLTGAQIKAALEQQWQPNGASRPFLRLGISTGFTYTYDPSAPAGSHITRMRLDGVPVTPAATYSVTVNSFLASGGDNFTAFAGGSGKRDTGKTDLQAQVDYLDEVANPDEGDDPLPVDYSQRSVGVTFPAAAPASYRPGDHVTFDVSSFAMTNADDVKDAVVEVRSGSTVLGTFALDNAAQTALPGFDEVGRASVDVVAPTLAPGVTQLTLVGTTTGTSVTVPIVIDKAVPVVAVDDVAVEAGQPASITVTVSGGASTPTGEVEIRDGGTVVGTATLDVDGMAVVTLPAGSYPAGDQSLTAAYLGDGDHASRQKPFTLTVVKAAATVSAGDVAVRVGQPADAVVTVTGGAIDPTGTVEVLDGDQSVGSATLNANGRAVVSLDELTDTGGTTTLTAVYAGDANTRRGQTTFTLIVTKVTATITAGKPQVDYGTARKMRVALGGVAGLTPSGTITLSENGTVVATQTVTDAVTLVALPARSLGIGTHTLTVAYSGDGQIKPATTTSQVIVSRGVSVTRAVAVPVNPRVNRQAVTVNVTVRNPQGVEADGQVRVAADNGSTSTVTLVGGKASVPVGKFTTVGDKTITVTYLGSALLDGSSRTITITVRP